MSISDVLAVDNDFHMKSKHKLGFDVKDWALCGFHPSEVDSILRHWILRQRGHAYFSHSSGKSSWRSRSLAFNCSQNVTVKRSETFQTSKHFGISFLISYFCTVFQCAVLIHLTSRGKSCHTLECKTRPRTSLGILSLIQPLLVWLYTVYSYCQTGPAESIFQPPEEKQPKKCTFLFSFGCCLGKIHTVSTSLCLWCEEHDVRFQHSNCR